jgi:nucleoside transporter
MSLPLGLRFRLSAMMFLEYAVWGAWTTVGFVYFQDLGFSDGVISQLFGVMFLACIVAPLVGGQIADRWFPTQRFLAVCHLAGGVFLFLMARERSEVLMLVYMSLYCLLYAPTLALTNSLAFHHMADPDRDFGKVRVWGTIGWIAAGWLLYAWREAAGEEGQVLGDLFYLAGAFSVLLGLVSLALPQTPPSREPGKPFAFIEALKLCRDKNFVVFLAIAFVVTTELQFYYIPTSGFLKDIGIAHKWVSAVMTIAQAAELLTMWFLLSWALRVFGVRWTLAIGVIAWPLRYILFALGEPTWLVCLSLAFHGMGFTFFFVVSQIYVNNVAGPGIRGSVQSLLTLVTVGLGNWVGTQIYWAIKEWFTSPEGVTDWTSLFLFPCGLTAACAVAYLVFFRPPEAQVEAAPAGVTGEDDVE